MIATTVDRDLYSHSLRFRCNGAQNDKSLAVQQRISEHG